MKWKNHYIDGHVHFVTGGVGGFIPIFEHEYLTKEFITVINDIKEAYKMKFIAYVIMPEHYHFLLHHPKGEIVKSFLRTVLSKSSGRILQRISAFEKEKEFDWKYARKGIPSTVKRNYILTTFRNRANGKNTYSLWKEQCRVLPLNDNSKLIEKIDYIHNNPVKRRITESPDLYAWSSCQYWSRREPTDIVVESR